VLRHLGAELYGSSTRCSVRSTTVTTILGDPTETCVLYEWCGPQWDHTTSPNPTIVSTCPPLFLLPVYMTLITHEEAFRVVDQSHLPHMARQLHHWNSPVDVVLPPRLRPPSLGERCVVTIHPSTTSGGTCLLVVVGYDGTNIHALVPRFTVSLGHRPHVGTAMARIGPSSLGTSS